MVNLREKYERLKKNIEYHANKYYNEEEPEISDFEYNMLKIALKSMEKEHPEFLNK